MREILTVLGGLLIGILLTLGIIFLLTAFIFAVIKQMFVKMHEAEPKMRKLGEYIQRKQEQGIDLQELQNDSEYLALTADIQASLNPSNFLPKIVKTLLPRKWKESARLPQAIAYVNESLPQILAQWEPQELLKRASPKFLTTSSATTLAKNFESFAHRLGELQTYKGIKYFVQEQDQRGSRWNFVVEADFEQGGATITGQVFWKSHQILFDSFYVSTFTEDV
jgi:hypothetical protein